MLAGTTVMVLPVQYRAAGHAELDQEIEYALEETGGDVSWVFPADLRSAIERNPGIRVRIDALSVQGFLGGELERIGDPLFGDLYRLGALADAGYALLPLEVRRQGNDPQVSLELSAALLEIRSGYVLWFGVVEGGEGTEEDRYVLATTAEALARSVLR